MEQSSKKVLFKHKKRDKISWVDNSMSKGVWEFTFDGEKFFNMFHDYPWKLTEEEKAIFDKENPLWAEFFKDRTQE